MEAYSCLATNNGKGKNVVARGRKDLKEKWTFQSAFPCTVDWTTKAEQKVKIRDCNQSISEMSPLLIGAGVTYLTLTHQLGCNGRRVDTVIEYIIRFLFVKPGNSTTAHSVQVLHVQALTIPSFLIASLCHYIQINRMY